MSADPPGVVPDPVNRRRGDHPPRRIVIVGAGPGGIAAAIRLSRAGYTDITVLERAPQAGGTWFHNRYPGCACDVQSHFYSFSFELSPSWSRPYAPQGEILEYFQQVAARHGVADRTRFDTEVTALRWHEPSSRWQVGLGDGDSIEADIVIGAVGMFAGASTPQLPGLDRFRGRWWHSARWPQDRHLDGGSVAVVGSGATAVQLVPVAAERVDRLKVFIREPQWVLPREEDPYTEAEIVAFAADPELMVAARGEIFERMEMLLSYSPEVIAQATEAAMSNLEAVQDPEVRSALTPATAWGCHRPLLSNDYYPAFNLPTVDLVRSTIQEVTPTGIATTDGGRHQVDTIVFCTGYDTTRFLSSIQVEGRNGRDLSEAWSDGAFAYLGIRTPAFPNLFQLYGPNTNAGSILFMLECQVDYIIRHLQRMDDDRLPWTDISQESCDEYNRRLQDEIAGVAVWGDGCSGYYRSASGRIVTQWPGSMADYRARTLVDDFASYETSGG